MIREIHTRGYNEGHCTSGLSTTVVVASTSVQLRDQALAGPKVSHAALPRQPARRSETYLSPEFERQSVEVVRERADL